MVLHVPCSNAGTRLKNSRQNTIHDKQDTTGQGRYPEWEYFDAMSEVMAAKHSTEPPVILESFSDSQNVDSPGFDETIETQDMSGRAASERSTRQVMLQVTHQVVTHYHLVLLVIRRFLVVMEGNLNLAKEKPPMNCWIKWSICWQRVTS